MMKLKNLSIVNNVKNKCRFCKDKLKGDDPLGYHNIGYCKLSCMLLAMELRISNIEQVLNKKPVV